jgi:phage tail-like protein
MTGFTVNPHRLDPYKNFKFRVVLDGRVVPGVLRVGALRRRTEVILWRDGAFPSAVVKAPGVSEYDAILLERGITHDTTFEDWAAEVHSHAGDAAMSLAKFRKDLRLDLLNEQGAVVLSYMIFRAWVSEYQALPALEADGNAVAIESVLLAHEGFERDRSITEPKET